MPPFVQDVYECDDEFSEEHSPVLEQNELKVPQVDPKEFPLTHQWIKLIISFSLRFNSPIIDLLQEAYILEWNMSSAPGLNKCARVYASTVHKQNVFKKALYRWMDRKIHGMEAMENKSKLRIKNEHRDNQVQFDVDFIDSIIQMRPFDEVFFQDFVAHTATLLGQKDLLAKQLFLDKMSLQLKWKELRLQQYRDVSHRNFQSAVKLIKRVVRHEVCLA